ncbi:tyrosine-type recombinase/integrase [Massiliimalia timonensis]|uniref:tyrosine-type recombinase/integrase n=1 Tax=Massiliimalia timonensis TaxID=1987501 RepID=UPI00189E4DAF
MLESYRGYRNLRLKFPKNAPTRKVYPLEDYEQQEIEKACLTDPYGDAFLFLLYTGLRRLELYRLKWKDIDWENECLLVEKSKNVCNILDDNKK